MKYLNDYITKYNWINKARKTTKSNLPDFLLIKKSLINRYFDYEGLIQSYRTPLANTTFSSSTDLLKNFYEKPPTLLSSKLKERRNNDLEECPYCGKPSTPNTLDHFIPKTQWPDFSIYPNNLVPQCRSCAPIKGEDYYCNQSNQAIFIHPFYFDYLSKVRFKVIIDFNTSLNKVNTYSVEIIHPKGFKNLDRVRLHFENLNVQNRIIAYCIKEFRRWETRLSQYKFDIEELFSISLGSINPKDIGKNWETAFFQAVLDNKDCIDYFNNINTNTTIVDDDEETTSSF
ncbi:HNH endonuclease [Arcobacter aquimarinus]|uniref:HNH endonuclease n=1 Tax=Arcobacter aquimarinus TaxID=1315211 RepID=A0AAE7E1Y4_9BACT|nr:HNH endonuclease [Arcobacter aquimarinus]QKE26619.1 hypothetical protein AAQM_1883 [Arcobacter aquimarinus]RXI36559.1 HNH endonuclease [Arcobacter aquimarinus]